MEKRLEILFINLKKKKGKKEKKKKNKLLLAETVKIEDMSFVENILRQGPEMRERLKSLIGFFRSDYLWRVLNPKFQHLVNKD